MPASWIADDLQDLRCAKRLLETPKLAAQITELIGWPVEKGLSMLPKDWHARVTKATHAALMRGLEFAVWTMDEKRPRRSRDFFHKMLVAGTGAAGGALGLAAMPVELPVSTCLILRSIAEIAQTEGHSIESPDTKLACLSVLALGGKSAADDASETGYWAVRSALAKAVSDAATYLAQKGMSSRSAPALVRLMTQIAARFQVRVTQQIAAKAVPVVGAVAGGAINLVFMNHFQDMARGHFIVRRLEAKYGLESVKSKYDELSI
jgi:hypothetical protein